MIDRVILGSNPLGGTDHFLRERSRLKAPQITDELALGIVRAALESGAQGFSCNADTASYKLLRGLKSAGYSRQFGLYPLFPNSDLVPALLKSGTVGAVTELLKDLRWSSKARALLKGGWSWITSNPITAGMTYIDVELARLRQASPDSAKVRSVVLHELVTDSVLALQLDGPMLQFVHHVNENLGLMPGFVTRNFPRFVALCNRLEIPLRDILIMTPFNSLGFQMTPNRRACETTLNGAGDANIVGISLLAGGRISLDSAMDFLKHSPKLKSVAVGVSSLEHARVTFRRLADQLSL